MVNNAPNTGSGADGGSSLAARRARLRGSLARASFPQDENGTDPSLATQSLPAEESNSTVSVASAPTPTASMAEPEPPAQVESRLRTDLDPALDQSVSSDPLLQPYSQLQSEPQQQPTPAAAPTVALSELDSYLENITKTKGKGATAQFDPAPAAAPVVNPTPAPAKKSAKAVAAEAQAVVPVSAPIEPLPPVPDNSVEILTNIDSALNACATNLAALQRIAGEQTDVLKGLTDTLQNQTLFEIGLNLNSLTESLSAALEPMKAIGELVPAMDQLVTALEGREVENTQEKLSPDQLVTSLADQLSAGVIDPWTFKCAYMAIYPSEHPADLLHRLVELLGTQRLSGDLFRAAYEAVQGAEPPARSFAARSSATAGSAEFSSLSSIDSDEIRAQIEELQRANEETARRQEVRELELQNLLKAKDEELQEAQELLNSRYDEFNARYEEVADALNKREEEYRALIESKDMELVEKESELNLLRAQMEELRNQTEDMVKDMQQQLQEIKVTREDVPAQASAPGSLNQGAAGGFFDSSPQQPRAQFEAPPGKQPFDSQQAMQAVTSPGPVPIMQQPQPETQQQQSTSQPMPVQQLPQQPMNQTLTQPMPAYQAQVQSNGAMQPPNAGPQQQPTQQMQRPQQAPTTPFTPGPGSYGSGVRAQVFEVIVRQALAGAPWREICKGPMQVNNISPEEVESEVKRRQAMLDK